MANTKAMREKAERLMLKDMLDKNPKLKATIDALIDKPHVEIEDIVRPEIEKRLKEQYVIGVKVGFQTGLIQAYAKIQDMNSADEIKVCLRDEANKIKENLGLKVNLFDSDGKIKELEDEGNDTQE